MTANHKPSHAPDGHPTVPHGRTGILIANLGTPNGFDYWSMRRYLNEFLSDKRVIDYPAWKWQPLLQLVILTKRPFTSGRAYRSIWNNERNESPMLSITREQTRLLREMLSLRFNDNVRVDYCMRYGSPSVASRLKRLIEQGCRRILYFPLYPQYSDTTTATANDQLFRALMRGRWQPALRTVEAYCGHPEYIDALARSILQSYSDLEFEPESLVVSFHGLPQRYLEEGDPYHCQCQKTSRLLREKLGWNERQLVTAFQSRFGKEEWLKPYTVEEVARLAANGVKNIALVAPGFSSDCIETLEEINEEIRHSFLAAGGEQFAYIPCLNSSDDHIRLLEEIIVENLHGWTS